MDRNWSKLLCIYPRKKKNCFFFLAGGNFRRPCFPFFFQEQFIMRWHTHLFRWNLFIIEGHKGRPGAHHHRRRRRVGELEHRRTARALIGSLEGLLLLLHSSAGASTNPTPPGRHLYFTAGAHPAVAAVAARRLTREMHFKPPLRDSRTLNKKKIWKKNFFFLLLCCCSSYRPNNFFFSSKNKMSFPFHGATDQSGCSAA